jgi:RHS repeat-associated protein
VAVVSNGPDFTVRLGETLALDGSASYSPLGNPLTYNWLWGDGAVSNHAPSVLSHLYAAGGPYLGALTVADNRGGSNTYDFQVTVGPSNSPPVIVLTVSTDSPFVENAVTFDATASFDPDGDPMTFAWDFGDRSKTTGPLVTHVFHQISDFTVTLTVADNHGGVSTATQLIHALNAPPVFASNPRLLTRAGTNYTYTPTITDPDGDSSTFQLMTGPLTMSCDTNTGTLSWLPGTNNLGPNSIVLRATDANGASSDQSFTLVVSTPLGPQLDLQPTHMEMTNVVMDSQTLALSGTVRVFLTNNGSDPVPVPFTVSVFVDADFDGAFSTNADYVVGYGVFPAGFPANGSAYVDMTVNGPALFKDCPLYAFVDSQNTVPEYNEFNNIMRSGSDENTNTPPVIDLSASFLQVGRLSLPTNALLTARLGNCGLVSVPTNVPMAFYDGDPQAGGQLIGVARSTMPLNPGLYQDLSVTWAAPTITTHTVFVVADDSGYGTNLFQEITLLNNTFSVEVDLAAILPPIADAGPNQNVNAGDTVVLNGRGSSDPQGRPLTYKWSMLSIPIGSQAHLTGTNTVSPSFVTDVGGLYSAQLVVNNGIVDSTNLANAYIAAIDTNVFYPPKITSTPSFQCMVSVLYTYQVTATDPQSKPLKFRLPQAPSGMTINTNTGLVSWTPANTGNFFVQVAADGVGGSFYQGYTLTVIAFTNLPPQFTSAPVTTAAPNAAYSYTAVASSPVGNSLTYSLSQQPSGMSINAQSGVVAWTPASSQLGGNAVTVVANDGHGGTATQNYNLVVLTGGTNGPVVQPIPDQTVTAPATFATFSLDSYVSDPNYAPNQLTWTATGTNLLSVVIDSNRVATVLYPQGVNVAEQITFLATDPAGKSGYSAPTFTVIGNATPPVAAIANLSATDTTSIQTGFFNLLGTADDPGVPVPVAYRIRLYDASGALVADVTPAPLNAGGWHEGRVPAGGSLGNLDFTLIRNGAYTLMLEVQGGAQTASATAPIAVDTQLKVGQMKLSQQDLLLSAQGVNLAVIRSYDSLNLKLGDFGYSWSYAIADLGLTIDEQRAQAEDVITGETFSLRTGGGWDVTLDMPDTGRRVTFDFSITGGNLFQSRAVWTPPPGVNATLVPTCSSVLITLPGGMPPYWQVAGIETDWQNFDFPGFILTLKDGTQFQIDRNSEGEHYIEGNGTEVGNYVKAYSGAHLSRITQRTGDHTDFVRQAGVLSNIEQYNNSDQKLKSMLFQRDGQNRITNIYSPDHLDANGVPTGPPSLTYEYDNAGNLVKVNKLVDSSDPANPSYSSTTYVYANPRFPHYITEVKDSRGLTAMRTEYDVAGRLVAIIDAYGNRTLLQHDLAARTETMFDRQGNPTQMLYDDRGNVIAQTDALGHTTSFTYDDNNELTSLTDPLGNTRTTSRDSSGNVTSLTDPLAHVTKWAYDTAGLPLAATDPLGNTSTNQFDAQGNLVRSVNALGQTTDYQFNAGGQRTGIVDSRGHTVLRWDYGPDGKASQITDASGIPTIPGYDDHGKVTSWRKPWVNPDDPTDTRFLTNRVAYNELGLVTNSVNPSGLQVSTEFDDTGKLLRQTDPRGNQTINTYDLRRNLVETDYPDGTLTRTVYDENDHPVLAVDRHPRGTAASGTQSIYDAVGRQIASLRLSNVVVEVAVTTNLGVALGRSYFVSAGGIISSNASIYDAAGRVVTTINSEGRATHYEYDAAGQNTAIVDALGNRTEFEYDDAGRKTLVRDALQQEVRYFNDALGKRVRTIFPDGTSTWTTYDNSGQLSSQTDAAGRLRTFETDTTNRVLATVLPAVVDPEQTNALVQPRYQYAFDLYGKIRTTTDPKGRRTRMTYDEFNRQVGHTLPLGQQESMSYDAFGNLYHATDFNGQVAEFLYDGLGRLSAQNWYAAGSNVPGRTVALSYDAWGRVAQQSEARGATSYAYDAEGRTVQITSPEGTIHYEYDPLTGRLVRTWTQNSDTRYVYDELGRPEQVQTIKRNGAVLLSPEVTAYTYTAVGNRESVTLPNGVRTAYQYDNLNRLTLLNHYASNGQYLASFAYQLAADGRRTGVTEIVQVPGGAWHTNQIAYTYDALKRLVREQAKDISDNSSYDARYSYDLVGNRLERTVSVAGKKLTTTYAYDDNDRLLLESNVVVNASSKGAMVPLRVISPDGSSRVIYRPPPSAWCYYLDKCLPYALLAGLVFPVALISARRWQRIRVLTRDLSPDRALLPRCLAGFLAALMAVTGVDTRVLADEAGFYATLNADTWGLDGAVTTYQYDANGAVVRKVTTGPKAETVDYSYDLAKRLTSVVTSRQDAGKQLISAVNFAYDVQGNRVRSESRTTIDGMFQTGSTNLFLVDSMNLTGYAQVLEELPAAGATPTVSYTLGPDVIAQCEDGDASASKYFLRDGHDSTRLLVDATGAFSAYYAYEAFGMMLGGNPSTTQPGLTKTLYAGERFDPQLQQYYLRARDYDPSTGRFATLDPLPGSPDDPQSLHKYAYCLADPVNRVDPTGAQTTSLAEMSVTTGIILTLAALLVTNGVAAIYGAIRNNSAIPDAQLTGASLSLSVPGAAALAKPAQAIAAFAAPVLLGYFMDFVNSSGNMSALAAVVLFILNKCAPMAANFTPLGSFGISGGGEVVANANDRNFGLFTNVSSVASINTAAPTASLTGSIYVGAVWGCHHYNDYQGPCVSVSVTLGWGSIAGPTVGFFFNPTDSTQFGTTFGVAIGLGSLVGPGAGVSSTYSRTLWESWKNDSWLETMLCIAPPPWGMYLPLKAGFWPHSGGGGGRNDIHTYIN